MALAGRRERGLSPLDEAGRRLAVGQDGVPQRVAVKGRSIHVPRADRGLARFTFRDLCEAPLAATECLCIAREFHTIILDPVPVMSFETRNAAKRFIILIEALYDMNVTLIASAAAAPNALYRAKQGFNSRDQAQRLPPHRNAFASLFGAAARHGVLAKLRLVSRDCRGMTDGDEGRPFRIRNV